MEHSEAIAERLREEISTVEDQLSRLREALAAIEGKKRVRKPSPARRRRGRARSTKRSSRPTISHEAPPAAAEPAAYLTEAATLLNEPSRGTRTGRATSSRSRRAK